MKPHLTKLAPYNAPLEQRIDAMLTEIGEFVEARAREIQQPGLPLETCLGMLYHAAGGPIKNWGANRPCLCKAALAIVETRHRDAEIAIREKAKEDARQANSAA